jgi:hypothetical protein
MFVLSLVSECLSIAVHSLQRLVPPGDSTACSATIAETAGLVNMGHREQRERKKEKGKRTTEFTAQPLAATKKLQNTNEH